MGRSRTMSGGVEVHALHIFLLLFRVQSCQCEGQVSRYWRCIRSFEELPAPRIVFTAACPALLCHCLNSCVTLDEGKRFRGQFTREKKIK